MLKKLFLATILVAGLLGAFESQSAQAGGLPPFQGKTTFKVIDKVEAGIDGEVKGNLFIGDVVITSGKFHPGVCWIRINSVLWKVIPKPPYHFILCLDQLVKPLCAEGERATGSESFPIDDGRKVVIEAVVDVYRPWSHDETKQGLKLPDWHDAPTVGFRVIKEVDPNFVANGGQQTQGEPATTYPPEGTSARDCPGVADGVDTTTPGGSVIAGTAVPVTNGCKQLFLRACIGQRIKIVFRDTDGQVVETVCGSVDSEMIVLRVVPNSSFDIVYKRYCTPYTVPIDYAGNQIIPLD